MRQLARGVFHAVGGPQICRYLNRSGVRILMYHRFHSQDTGALERQCAFIRRHYQPVTLQEIAEHFRTGSTLPPHAVTITIDDGFRDFLERGHPIFHAYALPTTVFLVSDFIDGAAWVWTDLVDYVISHTGLRHTRFPSAPLNRFDAVPLRTFDDRKATARTIADYLKTIDNGSRVTAMTELAAALEVDVPAVPPAERSPLTWDDVRMLAGEGVSFGAHTKTHPILSQLRNRTAIEQEVVAAKRRIEEEIDREVNHFCYPNGRREDFTCETIDVLYQAGFQTAVTTEAGINAAGASPFTLRRLGVEPDSPLPYVQELLAGVRVS